MKIKTKLKTVFAIALATFCVGSAQAKEVQLSVRYWPDPGMRDSVQAIEVQGAKSGHYPKGQLEGNDWRIEVADGDDSCAIRVEMEPGGRFNYSAVSLDSDWYVEKDGDCINGKVRISDMIQIPAPALRGHAVTWDASSANATVEVRAEVPGQGAKFNFESGTKFPEETSINFTVKPKKGYGYVSTPEGWVATDVRDDVILCIEKEVRIQSDDVNVEIPVATKIVTPGSEENPWKIGGGADPNAVTAWTNGAEFVVQGEGTIANLSSAIKGWGDFAGGLTAIKIADPTVTGAAAGAFAGIGGSEPLPLTLPDGWQGDLPDEFGDWYGAKVTLTAMPRTVRNVTFAQRYPWNGKVDISCDLTGAGTVGLLVAAYTNGVLICEKPTLQGETTIDLEAVGGVTNGVKLVWDAATDLPTGFKAKDVKVRVSTK